MKYKLILLLFIPLVTFANADNIQFRQDNVDLEYLKFDFAQGSSHNVNFTVKNESEDVKSIAIYVEGNDKNSLMSNTIFFVDTLDSAYSEKIKQNNNNIILFCTKSYDNDDVNKWCEGNKELNLTLKPKESKKIFVIINIDENDVSHEAKIIAKNDEDVVDEIKLEYIAPNKNIKSIELQEFVLMKGFALFDFKKWINLGFKDQYDTEFTIHNAGTDDLNFEYCATVQSMWIKERVNFCNNAIIKYGDTKKYNLKVTVPRFGKVSVVGSVNFINNNNQKEEQNSESIRFISWPVQLLLVLVGLICVCVICVLSYKYIIKNMFGRKKKKKEKNKYTQSYIVKDTDNIISIAQLYGVPWKELAKINDIEPPYILISGETINVPGENDGNKQDKELENIKNNLDIKSKETQKDDVVYNQEINNSSSDVVAKIDNVGEIKKGSEKKAATEKVNTNETREKKILYASPKNMLTESTSEPTTRAIDIEWMREDEAIYTEEIQTQEKKMKTRFIIVSGLIFLIIVGGVWWSVTWFLEQNNQKNVSVDNLIEQNSEQITNEADVALDENINISQDVDNETPDNTAKVADENAEGDNKSDENTDNNSTVKVVEDIKIQVLNAGSKGGAAGVVTDEFTKNGYKTSTAQNAKNDYKGVVIYYTEDNKESLEGVAAIVPKEYGEQIHEESADVTKKYDVDFVIVLGS